MSSTALIYAFVKLVEFLVLYYCGKGMSKAFSQKVFWQRAFFPIVTFALIEGLRWGHLIDYNVYAFRYEMVNSWLTSAERYNPAFTIIVFALKCVGVPYSMFLVLQCAFLMFSGIFLLQDYKIYFRWVLPCLLVAFCTNENFIRFFFGLSFVLVGLYFLQNGKIFKFIVFSIIGSLVHFGLLPLVFLLAFSGLLNRKIFSPQISCILFIVVTFAVSISDLNAIVSVVDKLLKPFANSDYQLFTYARGMDKIIAGEGGAGRGISVASFSTQMKSLIIYVPTIFLAPKLLNRFEWGKFSYNMMIICIVISPVFRQVELLGRFTYALEIFCALSIAATFLCYMKKNVLQERKIYLFLLLSMFCYFYAFINAPFARQDYEMYFIWDSNGSVANWQPYHR